MAHLDQLLAAFDEAHRELEIALNGTSDDDLWRRPHERLWSIGEVACHVAFWEAIWLHSPSEERTLANLPIQSPIFHPAAQYYDPAVAPWKVELNADQLIAELKRIHEATNAHVRDLNPEYSTRVASRPEATWGWQLGYMVFHVGYHTGQIYSARHIFGHETEDN